MNTMPGLESLPVVLMKQRRIIFMSFVPPRLQTISITTTALLQTTNTPTWLRRQTDPVYFFPFLSVTIPRRHIDEAVQIGMSAEGPYLKDLNQSQ